MKTKLFQLKYNSRLKYALWGALLVSEISVVTIITLTSLDNGYYVGNNSTQSGLNYCNENPSKCIYLIIINNRPKKQLKIIN